MKANVKKEWDQLSPSAQKRITDALVEETYNTLDNELVVAQFNWMRMGAWALHMIGKSSSPKAISRLSRKKSSFLRMNLIRISLWLRVQDTD